MKKKNSMRPGMDRRNFLKCSAFLGGAGLVSQLPGTALFSDQAAAAETERISQYPFSNPENILYSVCQQCNTQCGIRAKIKDGAVVKIDGNPYSPWNMLPHISQRTPLPMAARVDARLCPKGQAGVQSAYDPYRITKVLKRAGKRGEGKWITIPFKQAVEEIVEGGYLFKNISGEQNRRVKGLRAIRALTAAKLAREMSADVTRIWKKQMTVAQFKERHRSYLDTLIDPDYPDLGPKNNQFVFTWGRMKGGRGDLVGRVVRDAFGSVNAPGHTTVCQGSLYFTGKAMSEQYVLDQSSLTYTWTGGKKFYWQGGTKRSEIILFFCGLPLLGHPPPPT